MKPKTLFILLGVLLVLAAVYLAIPTEKDRSNRGELPVRMGEPLFPDFDPAFVDSMSVTVKDDSLRFTKVQDEWFVEAGGKRYPVDPARIERISKGLDEVVVDRVVSTRPELHTLYEVDDATATQLVAKDEDGDTVVDILIGKRGATGQTCFVREPGEDATLVASRELNGDLQMYSTPRTLDVDPWINKYIWSVERNDIVGITLQNATGTIRLERPAAGATQWTVVEPETFPAKISQVNTILSALTQPRASELLVDASPAVTGLAEPSASVVLSVTPAGTHTLLFGKATPGGQLYVQKQTEPDYVYVVRKASLHDNFFKPVDDFREPTPAPAAEEPVGPLPGE